MLRNLFKIKLEYYKSIDELPIKNWFKIQRTNDLSHLLKTFQAVNESQRNELELAFDCIWKEYIDTFGVSESMRQVLELRRDIMVDKCDMFIKNDRSKLTFIRIKEAELQKIISQQQVEKYDTTRAYIEKYMGFRIDDERTTTKEYYSYLKLMELERSVKNTPTDG